MNLTALGFRNSFRKPIRTGLSILGIALCITLILTVAAVSQRYTTVVGQSYSLYGNNVAVVSKTSLQIEGLPVGGTLPEGTGTLIEAVEGVSSVTPMLIVVDATQLAPANITIGIPIQNFTMFSQTAQVRLTGIYPTSPNQIVVGSNLAAQSNLAVGSTVKKGGTTLQVSGIMSTSNLILANSAIMPLQTAQTVEGYDGLVSAFLVSPTSEASELIRSIDSQVPGVEAINPAQGTLLTGPLVSSVGQISEGVQAFSEVVAFLFVAIISTVNITERRDEFLTIRAIGSSSGALLKIGSAEIGLISVTGVLFGLVLSSFAIGEVLLASAGISLTVTIPQFFQLVPLETIALTGASIVALGIAVGAVSTTAMLRRLE